MSPLLTVLLVWTVVIPAAVAAVASWLAHLRRRDLEEARATADSRHLGAVRTEVARLYDDERRAVRGA
jgi:hypothetical protein